MFARSWQLPKSGRRGFTLVEVLLVLALLVLFATLLLPGVNSILREINARGPEQILSTVLLAARSEALASGRTVELRYEAEERRFWSEPAAIKADPLPAGVRLDLLPPATGATVLLGGELIETGALPRIRFFPDGTCDPFRVRLREGALPPRLFTVDPWTCALSLLPQP